MIEANLIDREFDRLDILALKLRTRRVHRRWSDFKHRRLALIQLHRPPAKRHFALVAHFIEETANES